MSFQECFTIVNFCNRCCFSYALTTAVLKFLNSVKHIHGKLERWNMLLSGYKYQIEHIKKTKNVVADTLSRIELPTDSDGDNEDFDDKVANINTISDVTLDGICWTRQIMFGLSPYISLHWMTNPMTTKLLRQTHRLKTIWTTL